MPYNVISIGARAFAQCNNLRHVSNLLLHNENNNDKSNDDVHVNDNNDNQHGNKNEYVSYSFLRTCGWNAFHNYPKLLNECNGTNETDKILDSDSIHYICDINRDGNQYLQHNIRNHDQQHDGRQHQRDENDEHND